MKHKIRFFFDLITNKRLRKDIKAIKIADKGYAFYAYELCKKVEILNELKKGPKTILELSQTLQLKNKKMLEAVLDFLVGKKTLEYKNNQYFLTGFIPQSFSSQEQEFVTVHYKGSEDWTLFFYECAEESLRTGAKHKKTGFDDKKAIELWTSVMLGPLYSLRLIAVKKLLHNIKKNQRIVDYGCGSGTSIIEILEKATCPIEIMGVDSSAEMLKLAKERIKLLQKPDKKVQLIKKDLSKPFYFETPFDHAFASILINHLPENQREKFYASVAKNLKSNGKFVLFQLVNQDKFRRVFSDWLLYVAPSHYGFPFLQEYLQQLQKHFSRLEIMLNGMIIIAHK